MHSRESRSKNTHSPGVVAFEHRRRVVRQIGLDDEGLQSRADWGAICRRPDLAAPPTSDR